MVPATFAMMAIFAGLLPVYWFMFVGFLFAVALVCIAGFGYCLALLVPLAFYKTPQLIPPLYAMALACTFLGNGAKKIGGFGAIGLIFAAIAGFSYSLIAFQGFTGFTLKECVVASVFLGAIFLLTSRAPVGKAFWPAPHLAVAAFFIYAILQFDFGNLVYSSNLATGFAISLALGSAAYVEGKTDATGSAVGVLLGTVIYVSLGLAGYSMLFFFVFFSICATTISGRFRGQGRKYGLRKAGAVLANIAPAALFALAALFSTDPFDFIVGFCASLGAALSDTISSELGQAKEPKPFNVVTWERGLAGDDGAVSAVGLAYGFFAAWFFACLAFLTGLITLWGVLPVLIGAFAGNLADTWLGGTVEKSGVLNNDQVNAWGSFMGGAISALLCVAFL